MYMITELPYDKPQYLLHAVRAHKTRTFGAKPYYGRTYAYKRQIRERCITTPNVPCEYRN